MDRNIMKNLQKVHAAVVVDSAREGGGQLAKDIGALAIAAIEGGIKSPAWEAYMRLFAVNQEQLQRLTVTPVPADEKEYLPQLRAYIVANAVCAGSTGTRTGDRVDGRINGTTVNNTVDNAFVAARPIAIPEVGVPG